METLLWSPDQITPFITHPDSPVRRWALERLEQRFPADAPAAVVPLLDDADGFLVLKAAELIGASADPDRFRPLLLERLPSAEGDRFARLAGALAQLDPEAARPWLLERLRRGKQRLGDNEFLLLVDALGDAGGETARQALWELFGTYTRDGIAAASVVTSLLQVAQPADIRRLVQRLRAWAPAQSGWRTSLSAVAAAANAGRLFDEMSGAAQDGLRPMLERAEWWLGRRPQLDSQLIQALDHAFRRNPAEAFPLLHAEARRLSDARHDDVAGWLAQWEAGAAPSGYRRQAVIAQLILEALLSPLLPHPDRLQAEAVLVLSLVCQLGVDRDDEATLAAGPDPGQALLAILAQDREHVLPNVVERVAALGPAAVPTLVLLLGHGHPEWGAIRAARALALLARQSPQACAAAIPALLDRINDQEGDFSLEACMATLSAIGPAAVEPIAAALAEGDDMTREIFLVGALGEIPTERSAAVVLDRLLTSAPEEPRDLEMYSSALSEIGSPSAIPTLAAAWTPGDSIVASDLLVLHVVNGLDHPRLAEWRALVQAQDARMADLGRSLPFSLDDAGPSLPAAAPPSPAPLARPVVGRPPAAEKPQPKPKRKKHRRRR